MVWGINFENYAKNDFSRFFIFVFWKLLPMGVIKKTSQILGKFLENKNLLPFLVPPLMYKNRYWPTTTIFWVHFFLDLNGLESFWNPYSVKSEMSWNYLKVLQILRKVPTKFELLSSIINSPRQRIRCGILLIFPNLPSSLIGKKNKRITLWIFKTFFHIQSYEKFIRIGYGKNGRW